MSRMTNLERLVQYQDELAAMREAGQSDTEAFKNLEREIKDLETVMPKYHPHVYQKIREGKNFGKIK
jgi:septal ring factor EnvC (AmiA/AmiB activator)